MTAPTGWLPVPVAELFGTEATADESYDVLTVDVPPSSWLVALEIARTTLSCTYFDWLSAVDEPGTGFRVCAHVVALAPVHRLLLRTTVPHSAPELPSAVGVYAGARWHERETHEMFGVRFAGHPGLDHLLLPETFEGHPLRKDFVLAARVAKAWPGAKEPGESEHGGPKRRQMLPPGVPDPNEWGPLKGQLPPAPARPTQAAAGRPAGDRPARATGERPLRRSRTAAQGSASQAVEATAATGPASAAGQLPAAEATTTARRARTAGEGSASQRAASAADETAPESAPSAAPRGPRRARTASGGSASQRAQEAAPPAEPATPARPSTPRSSDAPWHHARPAFEAPEAGERAGGTDEPTEAIGGAEPEEPVRRKPPVEPVESGKPGKPGSGKPAVEPGASVPAGADEAAPQRPVSEPTAPESAASEPAASEPAEGKSATPGAPAPEAPLPGAPAPDDATPERPPTPNDDRPGGPQ